MLLLTLRLTRLLHHTGPHGTTLISYLSDFFMLVSLNNSEPQWETVRDSERPPLGKQDDAVTVAWHILLSHCQILISTITSLRSSLFYSSFLELPGPLFFYLGLCGVLSENRRIIIITHEISPLLYVHSTDHQNTKGSSRPCRTSNSYRLPSELTLSIFHSLKWQNFGRFRMEIRFYWWV